MERISDAAPAADASAAREVVRCESCTLVQFRTQNNLCRRCSQHLQVPEPEPAPAVALAEAPLAPSAADDELPNVAGAIRQMRQRQGLSQRQLAERMRVPRTYVSKIENDKATPTIASLERMAAAMETSVTTLLQCTGSGVTPAALRELLADGFIREIMPFVARLGHDQMGALVNAMRQCSERRTRVH